MNEPNEKSSFHSRSVEQVLEGLGVRHHHGLSRGEARLRLKKHGPNKLREVKRSSIWDILLRQFKSTVIIVLAIACALALAFGHWAEGIAISAVLVVNTVLGFMTEWKATRSMEGLLDLDIQKVRVRRDGNDLRINSEKLVPGDVFIMEAGDIAPADIRLIESNNILSYPKLFPQLNPRINFR